MLQSISFKNLNVIDSVCKIITHTQQSMCYGAMTFNLLIIDC